MTINHYDNMNQDSRNVTVIQTGYFYTQFICVKFVLWPNNYTDTLPGILPSISSGEVLLLADCWGGPLTFRRILIDMKIYLRSNPQWLLL